jgi:glucosamine-6-phosphate deaminase
LTTEVYDSDAQLADALARRVADLVAAKSDLVIGLPAGRTPIVLYRAIVAESRARGLDWSRVRAFTIDEFLDPAIGASRAASAPASAAATPGRARQPFEQFVYEHLLEPLGVDPARTDHPDGRAANPEMECDRYERAINAAGGLDLILLGIGANGHVGFNEPASALHPRTHVATLTAETRAANAYLFDGDASRVPPRALTMGMETILGAREIALVATGAAKAGAVRAMRAGSVTPAVPASFLQRHPAVTVMLDRAAAGA